MNKFRFEMQNVSNHQKNLALEQLFCRSHIGMSSFQYKDDIYDFQLCQFNQKSTTQRGVFLPSTEEIEFCSLSSLLAMWKHCSSSVSGMKGKKSIFWIAYTGSEVLLGCGVVLNNFCESICRSFDMITFLLEGTVCRAELAERFIQVFLLCFSKRSAKISSKCIH